MKTMSTRLREARRRAGLTQNALAARIGVCRSAVAQWERVDGTYPTSANLGLLAVTLACPYEWLATGRGPRVSVDAQASAQSEILAELRYFARNIAEEDLLQGFRELKARDQVLALEFLQLLGRMRGAASTGLRDLSAAA